MYSIIVVLGFLLRDYLIKIDLLYLLGYCYYKFMFIWVYLGCLRRNKKINLVLNFYNYRGMFI